MRSHACPHAGHRCGRYDRARFLILHDASGVFHPEDDAPEEYPKGRFRLAEGRLCDRPADSAETCIVEQAVQSPVTLHRVGNERLDLALLPNIGAEVGDRRPKFVDEKRPLVVLDVRRDHLRALAKEKLHRAAADPAGAARNNCDLARKPTH